MSKRPRGRRPPKKDGRARTRRRDRRLEQRRRRDQEPDLVDRVALALEEHPLSLLELVSGILAILEPPRHPFGPEPSPDVPGFDDLVESFLGTDLHETSALLAVFAAFSDDELFRRRALREITGRADALPGWLADLGRTRVTSVREVAHVLGDGENHVLGVLLPDGTEFTTVVYVDHNVGTLVKDAFVLPAPAAAVVAQLEEIADDPDSVVRDLDPADARARIVEAMEQAAITYPPFETETWPACRALVRWVTGMLPAGGRGHEFPEWSGAQLADLTERFLRSPQGTGFDDPDHRELLESLLWFGSGSGTGDPLRWSPVNVEILLLDWVPRKIVADVPHLDRLPDLLRAFVRFCHAERGIRSVHTQDTLAAVDAFEAEYRQLIRADRRQGPEALLEALGVLDPPDPEWGLNELARAVGGRAVLDALSTEPLPDEPFDWTGVPEDVRPRVGEVLALVDSGCETLFDGGDAVEMRTACRRLLSRTAAADPVAFRRAARSEISAGTICWLVGRASDLVGGRGGLMVKDLAAHFGTGGGSFSQRAGVYLRALGIETPPGAGVELGSPDYLVGARRAAIAEARDGYRSRDDDLLT
ncbi:hypothetical protein GCM10010472_53550 [Pseudonocardia halophobica]|uniref:Uncharacterized protein n=1 Tax=Pseudonocardia halophobica TaxID=29401 RepID=A0A9W6NW60_9PSEU|nr:hypothetical protein [Pseudonocardia halophobica]GLL12040.1 hypothetical protein GCM10017577_31810 [Pseudonocardia halophobica]